MIICAFLLQADGYLLVFALDDPDSFNLLTDLVPRWVAAFPEKYATIECLQDSHPGPLPVGGQQAGSGYV